MTSLPVSSAFLRYKRPSAKNILLFSLFYSTMPSLPFPVSGQAMLVEAPQDKKQVYAYTGAVRIRSGSLFCYGALDLMALLLWRNRYAKKSDY